LFAEIIFVSPQDNFFVKVVWISLSSRIEWCSRKRVVLHNFSRPNRSLFRSCARSKQAKFCTITFHLAYCKWLEKRFHAVQHNSSSLREKDRFSGADREKKNMILLGKVMAQSTHVLLVNYRDTTKIYVFRHEKIFYK